MLFLKMIAELWFQKVNRGNIVTNISLNEKIDAPVKKGDVLGKVTYSIGEDVLSEVNLIASISINKLSFGNMISYLFQNWCNLLR